jgi:hypothetical protein
MGRLKTPTLPHHPGPPMRPRASWGLGGPLWTPDCPVAMGLLDSPQNLAFNAGMKINPTIKPTIDALNAAILQLTVARDTLNDMGQGYVSPARMEVERIIREFRKRTR